MSSREDILARVRQKLGRNETNAVVARAEIDMVLAAKTQGPRPQVDSEKSAQPLRAASGLTASLLAGRLIDKSLAYSSTVDQVATLAEAPAAIARYLIGLGLPTQAVIWPKLADLDWASAGVIVQARAAQDADLVGITGCFCAVAETGTLMLCGAPDSPAAISLLPETHIAIVSASRIVPGMEEAFALALKELGQLPRAVNFISGPSRTGDIEQTIVLGAHGPYRVHLILVDGA